MQCTTCQRDISPKDRSRGCIRCQACRQAAPVGQRRPGHAWQPPALPHRRVAAQTATTTSWWMGAARDGFTARALARHG